MELFTFGPLLQRCRCEFLPQLTDRKRGLILGDGDGRFTRRLLQSNLQILVDVVDISGAMLQALIRRVGGDQRRVTVHQTDVKTLKMLQNTPENESKAGGFDVIVSHFFLDCLTTNEVENLAKSIRPALGPDAVWVISEFAIPPNRFGRFLAKPLISLMYWAFDWLTGLTIRRLPDYHAALIAAGFRLRETRPRLHGLLVSEVWVSEIWVSEIRQPA